jgi:hypothetical protein
VAVWSGAGRGADEWPEGVGAGRGTHEWTSGVGQGVAHIGCQGIEGSGYAQMSGQVERGGARRRWGTVGLRAALVGGHVTTLAARTWNDGQLRGSHESTGAWSPLYRQLDGMPGAVGVRCDARTTWCAPTRPEARQQRRAATCVTPRCASARSMASLVQTGHSPRRSPYVVDRRQYAVRQDVHGAWCSAQGARKLQACTRLEIAKDGMNAAYRSLLGRPAGARVQQAGQRRSNRSGW